MLPAMRAGIPLLLGALASSARGEEPAAASAPVGTLGLESAATRYGTSYETVYQLNLKPEVTLRFDAFELALVVPLSTSATFPTYCCRTALGNATVGGAVRGDAGWVRYELGASLSAPTSRWSDAHASRLAATAALTRDAGYYLPDTTTLRASLKAEVAVTGWLQLGGRAGADYWLRPGGTLDAAEPPSSVLMLPLDVYASLGWAPGWSTRLDFRTLARVYDPLGPSERFLHELSGALAHEGAESRVELSVAVPLDASLRRLEMLTIGVAYARSF
jgi:hypothetical protein